MTKRRERGVSVRRFYEENRGACDLELVAGGKGLRRRILESTVNRPGLALAGFYDYFAWKRVQAIGKAEFSYLRKLSPRTRRAKLEKLYRQRIPCLVVARRFRPFPDMIELAEELKVPLLRTPMITMKFINAATLFLDGEMAPTETIQAGMVDIQGIGVLIRGKSGIGKTECALALLRRGYSLVADDVTRLRLVEGREVLGSAPEATRYYMEVRGLGIVDVSSMFGIASIRRAKRVDLVVTLADWEEQKEEIDRVGLERSTITLLGIPIPHVTLLVRPGREVAHLVEVAALNEKLRTVGWNAAEQFNERLIRSMTPPEAR